MPKLTGYGDTGVFIIAVRHKAQVGLASFEIEIGIESNRGTNLN
jgi:hypothetical protein